MYYYSTPVKKEKAESDKMSSDSSDRRLAKPPHMGAPPPEQEHLPCPRCESTNTKFCYYNNYNLSQPRHFCKSCRRYWTQGGTLRNIPVGGGSRKNTKRSRSSSATSSTQDPLSATPISMLPISGEPDFSIPNLNVSGSFTSLLNTQGSGFLALGGFGLGLGSGFEDVSFGLGNKVSWPFAEIGESGGGCGGVGNITAAGTTVGNSWQLGNGESALVDGECFAWPDLAISTPGKSLK